MQPHKSLVVVVVVGGAVVVVVIGLHDIDKFHASDKKLDGAAGPASTKIYLPTVDANVYGTNPVVGVFKLLPQGPG